MPAFRNVTPNRHSGRLGKHIPVIYDKDGWQVPDHEGKVEPFDDDVPIPPSPPSAHPGHASRSLNQAQTLATSLFDSSSDADAPSSVPARRNSHTRRRDPGHIPRPRNAFIFFRSAYISSAIASGEGQQNELSKHAGKVWNKMSPEERRPFCELAAIEKEEHYAKHPGYVYSPGRTGAAKGKPKAASVRKIGAGTSSSVKKRKASTAFEDSWSRSSDTSSGSLSPNSPLISAARPAKLQRAAAQRAVQRFVESPSPAPSARLLSPISDEEKLQYPEYPSSGDDSPATPPPLSYVPTSEIPDLEFAPMTKEEKSLETGREPPSPFHPHLDPVTGEFAYHGYNHDFMSSSMPILPYTSSSSSEYFSDNNTVDIPAIPAATTLQMYSYSAAPSLLSRNSLLSNADYSVASVSSYTPFNGELEGDSVISQYTDMMDMDTGSDGYFEMEQDPDASIFQFFNFD
ncbi:hypothetical protein CVT25_015453 [Psilocybe cyanescens]|uniref:HMG box domain-containing protein n=1 Tax=Psilocybe cyanescens TaxID=93625 RepID=A0A409WHK8_PSICY|nr:hypothetical protein CVT25_015453 [Psilocybe cyanescens]